MVQRAIEPFFTTKPPSVGSGLGLSMAYGFAKQSGGHLDIESALGVGTTVRLILPRAPEGAAMPADEPRTVVVDPRGTETILLVDDNQTLIQVTSRHLAVLGYRVTSATDATAALAILGSGEIVDLLLTDVVMPGGMGGPELAEAARRLRPGLRVLLTSGYAADPSDRHGQHMLRKPFDRRDLIQAVRTVLDGFVVTN
jgi:CheY-like chemotaxis protein